MGDYLVPTIWLIAGLALWIGGDELLVRGASALTDFGLAKAVAQDNLSPNWKSKRG